MCYYYKGASALGKWALSKGEMFCPGCKIFGMELIANGRGIEGITDRITFGRSVRYRCIEWKDLFDGGSFNSPIRLQDVADANRWRMKSSAVTASILFYTWGVGISYRHRLACIGWKLILLVWSSFETPWGWAVSQLKTWAIMALAARKEWVKKIKAVAPGAQLLKKTAGDKARPTARYSSEVACA